MAAPNWPNWEIWVFNIVMLILVLCLCGFVVYFYIYTKTTQEAIQDAVNKAEYINNETNKMDKRFEDVLDYSIQNQFKNQNIERHKADKIYVDTQMAGLSNAINDVDTRINLKHDTLKKDWGEYQNEIYFAHQDHKNDVQKKVDKIDTDIRSLNKLYHQSLFDANAFVLDETTNMISSAFNSTNRNINEVKSHSLSNTDSIARINNFTRSQIDDIRTQYRRGDQVLDGKISSLSNSLSRFMTDTNTNINNTMTSTNNSLTQYINSSIDNLRSTKNNFLGPITICNGNNTGCKMLKVDGTQMYVCDGTGFNCTALNA